MRRSWRVLLPAVTVLVLVALSFPASASHGADNHSPNMSLLFSAQNAFNGTNSDLAFWGDRAYVGNYRGFRIFDISNPVSPALLSEVDCDGPQNDISVWANRIVVLSVDSVMRGPECGAARAPLSDLEAQTNWEGLRIFDVTDPRSPRHIASVYQDCGSHTHTMVPDLTRGRLLVYNASYSLRAGPSCGPVTGPVHGRSPVHGVIQVVEIPFSNPAGAREIAEPVINYPGDPDNMFVPAEHGLAGFLPLRACHDIAVYLPARLVAGACAEQAQLWRLLPNGLPDTANPLWVFDNPVDENGATGDPADPHTAADFWHSATFTWDGRVVNFSDESFGDGCPAVTTISGAPSDTGRTYFLDVASGNLLSQFQIPRTEAGAYCSTHQGNVIGTRDGYFLAQAWYMGGADIIDFTDPTKPQEIAWYDLAPAGPTGGDNWSHYWYEGPRLGTSLVTYGQDGVHSPPTGRGFEVFRIDLDIRRVGIGHLNPQTQERAM